MKLLLPIIFITILSFALHSILVHFFTIRTIEITGDQVGISVDAHTFPDNLVFFPVNTYEQMILKRYGQIAHVNIAKKFPETLIFDISLRKPAARVITKKGTVWVDAKGYVLMQSGLSREVPDIDAPLLNFTGSQQISDPVVLSILSWIIALPHDMFFSHYEITPSGLIQARIDKTNIIFSRESDVNSTIATLQTILTGVRMKGTMPVTIDLHFAKPILIY